MKWSCSQVILFFYSLLNLIVVIIFAKKKKRLHILEILVYWMISSYIYQNFSALCSMNFQTLIVPNKLSYEFSHFLNRTILFPVLMVVFLDFYLHLNTFFKKALLILCFILVLSGFEWLAHFLNVLIHKQWRVWWSLAFWLSALLLLIGFMQLFRRLLYKGGLDS